MSALVSSDKLRIKEIFHSLQGESRSVGWPTVFIRLSGCPLRCAYCDTAYAFQGGESLMIDAIMHRVKGYGARHVCVTGGEPMAQRGCPNLLIALADEGYEVSLETSGAFDLSEIDARIVKVMDLKTPASGEMHRNLYENIAFLNQADQVKFVISNDEDYRWSVDILAKYALDSCCEVLFSPVAECDPAELADKILRDKLNVRFQIQLHKILWGNAPGK